MRRWRVDTDRWPLAAGLAGPLALVLIARVMLVPNGPVAADAAPLEPLPAVSSVASGAHASTDVERAAAYAKELIARPFGESPMYYPGSYDQGASSLVPAPIREQPVPVSGRVLPDFAVTSVMAGSRGSLAMVDGGWRRVGDEVRPGWVLGQIDGRSGTVRFLGSGGREVQVRVQTGDPN